MVTEAEITPVPQRRKSGRTGGAKREFCPPLFADDLDQYALATTAVELAVKNLLPPSTLTGVSPPVCSRSAGPSDTRSFVPPICGGAGPSRSQDLTPERPPATLDAGQIAARSIARASA